MIASKSKLKCLVVARDRGLLILEDCEIDGDVRAVGSGTIRLVRCRIRGKVESEESAKIERE